MSNANADILVTYPQSTDADMAELANFERMLHAILCPLFAGYPNPTNHQIGNAMKQALILAQSVYASCEQIQERYEAAETSAAIGDAEELL